MTTYQLTTEELGLLATGQRLTFSEGTEVVRFSAEDLDISVRQVAEGEVARVGDRIEVSYS
jgi:hypothetical protein